MTSALWEKSIASLKHIKDLLDKRTALEQEFEFQLAKLQVLRFSKKVTFESDERVDNALNILGQAKDYLSIHYANESSKFLQSYFDLIKSLDGSEFFPLAEKLGYLHEVDLELLQQITRLNKVLSDTSILELKDFFGSNDSLDDELVSTLKNLESFSKTNISIFALNCQQQNYKEYIYRTSLLIAATNGQRAIRRQTIDEPYLSDAIMVNSNNTNIHSNRILDSLTSTNCRAIANNAHRDAVQIIPPTASDYCDRFIGAVSNKVNITGNVIESTGQLQGIFSSDGLHENLVIKSNNINTNSAHKISINGMLSGQISGNTASNILLKPLRLGGMPGYMGTLWVSSMRESRYDYLPISGVSSSTDQRHQLPAPIRQQLQQDVSNFPLSHLKALYGDNTTNMSAIQNNSPDMHNLIKAWIFAQSNASVLMQYYNLNQVLPIRSIVETNLRCVFIQELAMQVMLNDDSIGYDYNMLE